MKINWFWLIYTAIFGMISAARLLLLISPESPIRNYYIILLPFDIRYWEQYSISILGSIFSLISIIPLIRFALHLHPIHKKFWKVVFFLRILGDFFGRGYEWKLVLSSFYLNPLAGISCLGIIILPLIPSYSAHFHYLYSEVTKPHHSS